MHGEDGQWCDLQNQVDRDAEKDGQSAVEPVKDEHGPIKPCANFSEAILHDRDQDRTKRHGEGGNKEGLRRMSEGPPEGIGVECEADGDHRPNHYVQHEV